MVPFERKKLTLPSEILEIQIAMVDMQKKEGEKGENAKIKKIPGQMFKAALYLAFSGMFNKIKPNEFGLEMY